MKYRLLIVLLLFSLNSLFGQDNESTSPQDTLVYTLSKRFIDNWDIGVAGGINLYFGEEDHLGDFWKRLSPSGEITLSKMVTPTVHLRGMVTGGVVNGWYNSATPSHSYDGRLHYESFNMVTVQGQVMFNISNAIGGYNPKRKFSVLPYLGVGAAKPWKNGRNNRELIFPVGVLSKILLSDRLDLTVELHHMFVNPRMNYVIKPGRLYEGMGRISVGLSFKVGNKRTEPTKTLPYQSLISITDKDTMSGHLQQIQEEKPIPVPIPPARDTVTIRDTVYAVPPLLVFFPINKWYLHDNELVKIDQYMRFVLELNPEKEFELIHLNGHADKATGNATINQYLSEQRVETVRQILIDKYNIPENRIITKAEGDTNNPFEKATPIGLSSSNLTTRRNSTMSLKTSEKIVLELLKSTLWGTDSVFLGAIDISDRVWQQVYSLSVSQGVLALVFDGILRLPESQHPSTELMLTWAVNVKLVEKRYNTNRKAIGELNHFFAKNNVEMVLLKGLLLSSYYPNPAHREYGDIDIYLLGREEDVDCSIQRLVDLSGRPLQRGVKHDTFYYKQIPVESHFNFLNINRFTTFFDVKQIEKETNIDTALLNSLHSEKKEWIDASNNCKVRVPSATFNYMFLSCHMAMHLPRGIVLRHLCDWACFLYHNRGRYNKELVDKSFTHSNFNYIASLLTGLVIRYLGLPSQYASETYSENTNNKLEDRIIINILRPFPKSKSNNQCGKIMWRTARFFREHWKHKMIYGDTLSVRAFRVIRRWLDKPSSTAKINY